MDALGGRDRDERLTVVSTVAVATPLTQSHVGALRPLLHAAEGDVVLDLTGVQQVDSIGLGLLVGARQRARRRGASFRLVNVEPALRQLLDDLGLWQHLALPARA